MKNYFVLLVVAVLAISLIAACGAKTETQLVEVTMLVQDPVTQVVTVEVDRPEDVAQPVEVARLVDETRIVQVSVDAKVGEIIEIAENTDFGEHTIVLNSASFTGDILQANFTVENKGTESIIYSCSPYFTARDSQWTWLDTKSCGSRFGGDVLPGDKIQGDICWRGAVARPIVIYYRPGRYTIAVKWEIKK